MHILHILHIVHVWFNFLPISRYLQKAPVVFPYSNSRGNIMETEKNHSLKHAPNDIAKWGDSVNTSCEGPETGHKEWVKKQGGKTNQGPAVSLSMVQHTLRKEASALLCEAVQGDFENFEILFIFYIFCIFCKYYIFCIFCIFCILYFCICLTYF
jgi:hypothetical protein